MKRVGLAIMRIQPCTRGHAGIINRMITDYETVIIGLGSAEHSREPQNPWTVEERMTMLDNVYGRRIKVLPLNDVGTERGTNAWCDYVQDKIRSLGMPEPTDYLTGSPADGEWYRERFFLKDFSVGRGELEDNAPYDRRDDRYFNEAGQLRRLHIIDRAATGIPPATELRTFFVTRSDRWKPWVPAVNHELLEQTFPEELKVPK